MGAQLKNFLYKIVGNDAKIIGTTSTALVLNTGTSSDIEEGIEPTQPVFPQPILPQPITPVNPGTIIEIRYHANIEVGGIVTGVSGVPEKQTATSGVPVLISSDRPTVTTNSATEKYVFAGWSISAASNTIKYQPGEQATFYADTDLYAVWRLSFTKLKWTKDYYWVKDDEPWRTNYENNPLYDERNGIRVGRISKINMGNMIYGVSPALEFNDERDLFAYRAMVNKKLPRSLGWQCIKN